MICFGEMLDAVNRLCYPVGDGLDNSGVSDVSDSPLRGYLCVFLLLLSGPSLSRFGCEVASLPFSLQRTGAYRAGKRRVGIAPSCGLTATCCFGVQPPEDQSRNNTPEKAAAEFARNDRLAGSSANGRWSHHLHPRLEAMRESARTGEAGTRVGGVASSEPHHSPIKTP